MINNQEIFIVNGEVITAAEEQLNWLAFTSAMNLTRAQTGDYFPQIEVGTRTPSTTTLGA